MADRNEKGARWKLPRRAHEEAVARAVKEGLVPGGSSRDAERIRRVVEAALGPAVEVGATELARLREQVAQLERERETAVAVLRKIARFEGHADKVVCLIAIKDAAELTQDALRSITNPGDTP